MIRASTDASVFYAATASPAGGSRELLKYHMTGQVQLVVCAYVVEEVRRNLAYKAPNKTGVVELLLELLALDVVDVDAAQVRAAAELTNLKDAPVVATALAYGCDYVLTYDRQQLVDNSQIQADCGFIVATPAELLAYLRQRG